MDVLQTEQAMLDRFDAIREQNFTFSPLTGNDYLFIALVCIAAIFVLWKPRKT